MAESIHTPGGCPKCGAQGWEKGTLYPAGVFWDIRFKAADASLLSLKKRVRARACEGCGYIELYRSKW